MSQEKPKKKTPQPPVAQDIFGLAGPPAEAALEGYQSPAPPKPGLLDWLFPEFLDPAKQPAKRQIPGGSARPVIATNLLDTRTGGPKMIPGSPEDFQTKPGWDFSQIGLGSVPQALSTLALSPAGTASGQFGPGEDEVSYILKVLKDGLSRRGLDDEAAGFYPQMAHAGDVSFGQQKSLPGGGRELVEGGQTFSLLDDEASKFLKGREGDFTASERARMRPSTREHDFGGQIDSPVQDQLEKDFFKQPFGKPTRAYGQDYEGLPPGVVPKFGPSSEPGTGVEGADLANIVLDGLKRGGSFEAGSIVPPALRKTPPFNIIARAGFDDDTASFKPDTLLQMLDELAQQWLKLKGGR